MEVSSIKKEGKTVPKQLGHLAAGLAEIIHQMDEKKGQNQEKVVEKKEKS